MRRIFAFFSAENAKNASLLRETKSVKVFLLILRKGKLLL